ncbi:MAG: hypothetical protein AB7O37_05730 [Vicinamibacteria bacterium]
MLACAAASVSAQASLDARISGSLDALDSAYGAETRGNVAGRFAPELGFAAGHGTLSYTFDGATYAAPGWGSLSHAFGGLCRIDLARDGKATLFAGADAVLRRNGELWSDADFDGLGARLNLELRPRSGLTLRSGYRFDDRSFAELPALDQSEHRLFASAHATLPSRTTLIAEVQWGAKAYAGEPLLAAIALPAPSDTPSAAGTDASGGTRGSNGRGAGGTTASGAPLESVRPGVMPSATAPGERARLVSWLVRAAQSLGERTGLAVEWSRRTPSGATPPALVTVPPQFVDDGVYDDPYASSKRKIEVSLKRAFASGLTLEARGAVEERDYTDASAVDAAGAPTGELRHDELARAGFDAVIPVFPSRTGATAFSLEAGYRYFHQRSNDVFYSSDSHALLLGLRIQR